MANAGIQFDVRKTVDSFPGRDTIGNMLIQNGTDTVILTKSRIEKNQYVFISYDKGNKKGNKNLAKYLCWYFVTLRIHTQFTDSGGGGTGQKLH